MVFEEQGNIRLTVDTGFAGWLALPRAVIRQTNLRLRGRILVTLADGRQVWVRVFRGRVRLGNQRIQTAVLEAEPLVGMQFMNAVADKLELDFQKKRWRLRR